jgi:methylated-DNA-[protein]-cysteine S-methyltransferase
MDEGAGPVVATLASPFGPIHVAVGPAAVVGLELLTTDEAFARSIARRLGVAPVPGRDATRSTREMLDRAVAGLEHYLDGDSAGLELPIAVSGRSPWDVRVLEAVRRVGWGQVASYGLIARAAGSPGAARAAGGAVGRNPIGLLIPCHRVIAADGTLGGYGGAWPSERESALALKRALLAHEGVEVPPDPRR